MLRGTPGKLDLDAGSWPGGVTWEPAMPQMTQMIAVVGPGDGTRVLGGVPDNGTATSLWSDDGTTRVELNRDATRLQVTSFRRLSHTRALSLPQVRGGWRVVVWDSSSTLLLAGGPVNRLIRCHVASGVCERVADGPGRGAVLAQGPGAFE